VSKPIKSSRWSRLARYSAYCAAALIAIVIAAALVLPKLLDTPAVRAEIQRKLSEAVQGEVAWDDLKIRILPAPHGVLRKARVGTKVPGTFSGALIPRFAFPGPRLRRALKSVALIIARG
jgi:hypothetical protein